MCGLFSSTPKKKRRALTAYEKDQILTRQKNKCAVRGCKSHFDKVLVHYDHTKPLALGGKDDISNIKALCPNHHAEKTRKDRHDIAEKKKKDKAKKDRENPWTKSPLKY